MVNGPGVMALAVCIGLLAASAARGAGPVVGWGAGATPKITASAIAVGRGFSQNSCAIRAGTGAVVCWGTDGGTPPSSVDGTAGTATAVAVGGGHSCAIQAGTGAVVCWGLNDWGQATPPSSVDGTAGTASAIAAGVTQSCAIQAGTGVVVCWGDNAYGNTTPPLSVDGTAGTASAIAVGAQLRDPGRNRRGRVLGK